VRPELEGLAAVIGLDGPPEVVDGDRVDADLGEAHGQLSVELVQPAHVRQDDDAGAGRLPGAGLEGQQRVAVFRQPCMRELADRATVQTDFVVFDGAPHSFFDRTADEHAAAADEAWTRLRRFVQEHS